MRTRLLSAAVLVPVVVVLFVLGDFPLTLGITVLAALAAYEVSRLVTAAGLKSDPWFAVGATVIAVLGIRLSHLDVFFCCEPYYGDILGWMAAVLIVAAVLGMRHADPSVGFRSWMGNVIAATYPSLLAFAALLIATRPYLPDGAVLKGKLDTVPIWLVVLVLTVWTLDSAAYLSGRYVPMGHFMNHISPKKTWSGAVGGTVAAVAVCTLLTLLAGQTPIVGVALGLVIAVTAQAGDLAESMLKRAAAVKDSGNLIPGHGGILDRVDSFLFAAPALFVALNWLSGLMRT